MNSGAYSSDFPVTVMPSGPAVQYTRCSGVANMGEKPSPDTGDSSIIPNTGSPSAGAVPVSNISVQTGAGAGAFCSVHDDRQKSGRSRVASCIKRMIGNMRFAFDMLFIGFDSRVLITPKACRHMPLCERITSSPPG